MDEVILYSTGCPKCRVLVKKLTEKKVPYTEITDIEQMRELGIQTVPVLSVNGELKEFSAAVSYINNL